MPNPNEPRPDFSDVKSGSASMGTPKAAAPPRADTYTVVAGDSLSKIALRFYGDAGQWKAIHTANRDLISNPDLIHPGQVLTIPRLSED